MPDQTERARASLAANISQYRKMLHLSTAELARRSGVAKATISHLERGMANPTVETLCDLSAAFGVEPDELLRNDHFVPTRQVVRAIEGARLRRGPVQLRFVQRFACGPEIIEIYTMAINAMKRRRSKGNPGHEHILVTEGRMVAGAVDDPVELGPGDLICFRADLPHVYQALEEDVKGVLLIRFSLGQPTRPTDNGE